MTPRGDAWHHRVKDVSEPFELDLSEGDVRGKRRFDAFGERVGMGTPTNGEDIWRGSAAEIPLPPDAGEQMTIVSTDAGDAVAGTGIQGIRVHYLDNLGVELTEDVVPNGVTGVDTVATNIRFVQRMHGLGVGSNGVAEGDITIHQFGTPATVYSFIEAGGNMSMMPSRMVPAGKTLHVDWWHAEEANTRRVAFRLRATSDQGVLVAGTFLFKDVCYLNRSTSGLLPVSFAVPEFGCVKITGWATTLLAEASCGWTGILVDNPA